MSVVATVRYKSEEHQNPWVLDLRPMTWNSVRLFFFF